MSTTNPAELNVEILLKHTVAESSRKLGSRRHEADASRESLMEEVLAATSDLERQITAGALDPPSALNLLLVRTLPVIAASGAAIGLVSDHQVVCCATAGTAPDIGASINIQEGLSGECVRSGKVVRSSDTAQDARVEQAVCQALSMRSAMAVPIRFAGKIIGVFEVFSAEPNAFDDWAELAISQLEHFIAGVANADRSAPQVEAAAGAASATVVPAPELAAEAFAKIESTSRWSLPHRWRVALIMVAALATAIAAVSYRVRDMMRSTRAAHPVAEISPPALPSSSITEPAPPIAPLSSEPAIAREDGQVAPMPDALKPAAGWHRRTASAPPRSPAQTQALSAPAPATPANPSEPPRKLDATADPPALAAVQPAAQREAVIGPVLSVPVTDPKLAAQQAPPPAETRKPGRPRFVSRVLTKPKKLKVLVGKDSNHEKNPAKKTGGNKTEPQAATSSTESP